MPTSPKATSWLTSLALLGQIAVTFLLAYLHTLESMDTVQPAPRLPGPREGTTQFSISMTGESVDSADQSVHTAPSSTTAFRRWKAATPATAVATAVGVQKKRQTVLDSLCVIKDYHDMVRRESYVDTGGDQVAAVNAAAAAAAAGEGVDEFGDQFGTESVESSRRQDGSPPSQV
nr:hypothetical protein BaRGS_020114 [Batillaria attramentaria]